MTLTCQYGTSFLKPEDKPCGGAQWMVPKYYINNPSGERRPTTLWICEKHAKIARQINPFSGMKAQPAKEAKEAK